MSSRLLAGLALLLAGCAGPAVAPPQLGEVDAHFWQGRDDQVIEIRALDRLALQAAALVLPDGRRIEAYAIETEANPPAGSLGGLTAAGIPPSGSLNPGTAGAMPGGIEDRTTLIGTIASSALIRVPDMIAYRQVFEQARIEVRLGDAQDHDLRTLKAPAPI